MEWRDQGILLSTRRHGESAAIIEVLTRAHGRHAGVVRGGASRRVAPLLQPGAQLDLTWRARLEDHLGAFQIEPLQSRSDLMADRLSLAGLNAVTALLGFALPEREPHAPLCLRSEALLDMIGQELWPLAYLRWEQALLDELGFGLDLTVCAVTGGCNDLAYVSPKSGRAVSRAGAGEWAQRLFPLPPELLGRGQGKLENILAGLTITGHFLANWLAPALGPKPLPGARARLITRLQKEQP